MAFDFIIEESQEIKGVHIITPSISEDLRGNIWTSFYQEEIEQLLPAGLHFKHDKFSQRGKMFYAAYMVISRPGNM